MIDYSVIALIAMLITGALGVWLALRKAPIERDGVYISTAEGATRILNSALLALEKEVVRLKEKLVGKDEVIRQKDQRIRELEVQLQEAKP